MSNSRSKKLLKITTESIPNNNVNTITNNVSDNELLSNELNNYIFDLDTSKIDEFIKLENNFVTNLEYYDDNTNILIEL